MQVIMRNSGQGYKDRVFSKGTRRLLVPMHRGQTLGTSSCTQQLPGRQAMGLQAALHCLDPPATHLNLDAQASISFQQLLQMLLRRQTNVPFPMLFFLSMKGSVKCYAKQ